MTGCNGVGKTTVARSLRERLDAALFHYPAGFRRFRRAAALDTRVASLPRLLYYLAATLQLSDRVRRHLARGPVICDRYVESPLSLLIAEGVLGEAEIAARSAPFLAGIQAPDVNLLLTADHATACARIRARSASAAEPTRVQAKVLESAEFFRARAAALRRHMEHQPGFVELDTSRLEREEMGRAAWDAVVTVASARVGPAVVKIGGSALRGAGVATDASALARLARELRGCAGSVVLVHGAGARARAALPAGHRGRELEPAVASAVRRALAATHEEVVQGLRASGLDARSVALPAPAEPGAARACVGGGVPVLCGGLQALPVGGARIVSSDDVVGVVAAALHARCVVFAIDGPGVLDASGALLPRIARADLPAVLRRPSDDADPTGGMRGKLEIAWRLAEAGIPVWIVDGRAPGRVLAALRGEPGAGTRVVAGA